MHLLIPFANCSSDGCASALRSLKLPQLQKLLTRLVALPRDEGDPLSLSPPHERALARSLGLALTDGLIPLAALEARQTAPADGGWAFITPCHWEIGSRQVVMSSLALPDFSAQESQTLMAAMQVYFAGDGITLHYRQPTRWLAHGRSFATLATASTDRVAGRHVANWLPAAGDAAALLRLQGEMQMLLYNHPVNDARIARGQPPVNSFWLSGTGALAPAYASGGAAPTLLTSLRDAALQEDWPTWARAWEALDAEHCAALSTALDQGQAARLTLCGERHAQTFGPAQHGVLTRLQGRLRGQSAAGLLEQL
ncbi:MAG: phosphoglycerate mutase [Rhodoferax sp.]